MPDNIFLDVLPRFDWAASEAGVKKLVGQFDGAAKSIASTFGANVENSAKRSVEQIQADVRAMQVSVEQSTNASSQAFARMVQETGRAEVATRRYNEAVAASGAESSKAAAAYTQWATATTRATTATEAHTRALAAQDAMTAKLTAGQAEHQAALDTSTAKMAAFGAAANKVGLVSAAAFTAAMYESGKAAGDFQQSQMRLVSSAGETEQGMKTVSEGILQMAGTVGYTSKQLSDGMYTVESAGYHSADALKVMLAAAQGAKAENADLAKVTDGLTTSMTDFSYKPEQAALVMSKLVTAVGESKANFEEFTGSLHSVEPAAAAAGIGLDDVYGSLARITQSGTSAEQATQNMADAIRHLQTATGPMRDEFAALGLDVNDVQDHLGQRGLAGTMQLISDTIMQKMGPDGKVLIDTLNTSKVAADDANRMFAAMPPQLQNLAKAAQADGSFTTFRKELGGMNLESRNLGVQWLAAMNRADGFSSVLKSGSPAAQEYATALQKATGDVAGMNVALQLTGPHANEANDAIKKVAQTTTDAGNVVKGFNETQKTLNAQMADAKAAFNAAEIELGDAFIPTLTSVASALKTTAEYLAGHKAILDDVIGLVGILGAAWGIAKGIMVFDTVITGIGKLSTAIFGAKTATDEMNNSLRGAGAAAAAGEVGVRTAAAKEVAEEGAVTKAATEADTALAAGGGAAGAGGALSKLKAGGSALAGAAGPIGWAALISSLGDTGLNMADSALGTDWLEKYGEIPGSGLWIAHQLFGNDDNAPKPPMIAGGGDPNAQAARRGATTSASALPTPTPDIPNFDQTATDAAAGGTDGGAAGGGSSSKSAAATATAPNINANLPFHPIDLNPADTPANQTYDEWVNSQKSVAAAMTDVDKTTLALNEAQAKHAELVKKGTATQDEWNQDAKRMAQAQLDNQTATQNLTIAQQKASEGHTTAAKSSAASGGGVTGTSILTGAFDFSPQGISKYFTAMLANLALGNPIGHAAAAERGSQTNPMYVSLVGGSGGLPFGQQYATGGVGNGINSDAALLANVPSGGYSNSVRDLSKGLGDCSSAVGDLVHIMEGQPTGGPNQLTTGNAAGWLPAHGFLPGSMPGAFNVGYNDHHMQATLPGGTNFNWGSNAAAASGGTAPNAGAFDNAFTQHYYLPVSPSSIGPAALQPPPGSSGADALGPFSPGGPADLSDVPFGLGGLGGGASGFKRSPSGRGVASASGTASGDLYKGKTYVPPGAEFGPPPMADIAGIPGAGAPGGMAPGRIGPFAVPPQVAAAAPGLAGGSAGRGLQGANLSGLHFGTAAPSAPAAPRPTQGHSAGQQYGAGQDAGPGFTSNIASSIVAAAGPAAAMAPGSAQAAKLADRTIGYLGQLGGIAAGGIMETFLPGGNGNPLADPSKSWLGKVALGFAGAHHDTDSTAGTNAGSPTAPKGSPEPGQNPAATPAASPRPDDAPKGGGVGSEAGKQAPVVGQLTVNTTNGVDTDAMTRDLSRYQAGMKR